MVVYLNRRIHLSRISVTTVLEPMLGRVSSSERKTVVVFKPGSGEIFLSKGKRPTSNCASET